MESYNRQSSAYEKLRINKLYMILDINYW